MLRGGSRWPGEGERENIKFFFAWSLIITHTFQNMIYENKKSQEIAM